MATIKNYGNGKYRVIACNGRNTDGKPNRMSWTIEAKSMKAAKKRAAELEYEFKYGKMKRSPKKYTFNNLLDVWREDKCYKDLSPKTKERYEGMLRHKLIPAFGVWPLEEIRPIDISRFISDISISGARIDNKNEKPYSDKTIQGYYILLHMLLDRAVRWEMVTENVCEKVDKPKITRSKAKYYEEDQIDMLLHCIDLEGKELEESLQKRNPNHRGKSENEKRTLIEVRKYMYQMHRAYIYLALASAARRSEVCGLNWTDIEFNSGYINIDRTLQYTKDAGKFTNPYLKNGEENKDMYLPEAVIEVLRQYKDEQEVYKKVLGHDWIETGNVFTAENGDLINPNNITAWFRRFLKKYELPYITLHQVRHTSISFMLNKNVPMEVVSKRAGHRDSTVTSYAYGHVYKNKKVDAALIYKEMFGKN